MKAPDKYTVTSFARGRSFLIVDDAGLPIYDGAPHGNDKPVIFHDQDAAIDRCARLNEGSKLPACPKCGSDDLDRIHHTHTFALPESWTTECASCGWVTPPS